MNKTAQYKQIMEKRFRYYLRVSWTVQENDFVKTRQQVPKKSYGKSDIIDQFDFLNTAL